MISRRQLLSATVLVAPLALVPRVARAAVTPSGALTPEMFGARGDGVTNDTVALSRLAEAVNRSGGGTVVLAAGKTYLVGIQSPVGGKGVRFSFEPHEILAFRGCSRPLVIQGNGARLKCAPGLRYGTFDRSGRRTDNPMPYTGHGEMASPYRHMIYIEGCSGPVEVADIELDGSVASLAIGGPYGDKGRQIAATGLTLRNNRGSETVRNIHTHHHARDGVMIDGLSEAVAGVSRLLVAVRSEYNGRQGCSIIGGRGYRFRDCHFNHTGRAGLFSPPGAGVDIEAEGRKTNRDFQFVNCEFADNRGVGMVADSGDSEGALFERCRFVGTTSWAAWPKKPRFRFNDCAFVGSIVQCYRSEDPERAAQFHSCGFFDDPKLSPTGALTRGNRAAPIANLGAGDLNVLFSDCDFSLTHELTLPWSRNAIYSDCRMRQASPRLAFPRGTYLGTNSIVGNVNLKGSKILGTLTVNGVPYSG